MASPLSKKWVIVASALLVFGGTSVFFVLDRNQPLSAAADTQQMTKITKGEIRYSVSGTSQLQAQSSQNIIVPSEGTVKLMNLTRSQPVHKDDILVVISNPVLEANLKEAQSALARLEKQSADLQNQLNHMQITAPIAGKLTLAGNVDMGSNVNKMSKLGYVSAASTLKVTLPFLLEEAVQLKAGDPVDLTVDGFMLTKTGKAVSVGRELKADANGNKTVDVQISVDNDGSLDAGMAVTAAATAGGREIQSQASGKLEFSRTEPILVEASGSIGELTVKNGDSVSAGQVIATVTNDSLQDSIAAKEADMEHQQLTIQNLQSQLDELTVKAPFDGVFSTDFADQKSNVLASYPVGAKIKSGTELGAVATMDSMMLPIQIDELDVQQIKAGLKAEVRVSAVTGKVFAGEVTQVSSVGVTTNGVTYYDAMLKVDNSSGVLKYGMTATADILIQDKKDVLLLPLEALQLRRGGYSVSLKKADGTVQTNHTIKIGIRGSTAVEVTEGLQQGDQVLIPKRQTTPDGTQQEIQKLRQQFRSAGGGGNVGGAGGGNFGGNLGGSGARGDVTGGSGGRSGGRNGQ
jgi:HlyD family secretion protein